MAGVLLSAVLVACQSPAGAQFHATVVQPDGSYPMPVVLGDETGLVTGIGSVRDGMTGGDLPAAVADPTEPTAVFVSWGTGACDSDTTLSFQGTGGSYSLDIAVHSRLSLGCTAQLLVRGLRIEFSQHVPADAIHVSGGR